MKKKSSKRTNNYLNKKRNISLSKELISEETNKNKKKSVEEINKYLTITKEQSKNNSNLPKLSNFLPKSLLINFSKQNKDYNIKCDELIDNKNKTFYQVRNSKILIYKNKKILFIHVYSKLILYEIKDNDSYIFLSEILFKEKLEISYIEKFFLIKNNFDKKSKENIVYLCFVCYNKIIISKLDMNNYNSFSIYDRASISENSVKNFYKMIDENRMMFDGITLITLFPKIQINQLSIKYSDDCYFKSMTILDEKNKIGICTDKEIFIYDINKNKNLGNIKIKTEISTYEMGIKKYRNNNENTLFILYSEKGVYLYDYEKKIMIKKFLLEKDIKTKIRKVKQLDNYDIIILYNYYNLAIYNVEKDIITYKLKSNWTKSPGNEDFPILVKMSNDIILFSSDPNIITILNYSKGDILGYITDKENKRKNELCKSIKVYDENLKKCLNNMKEFYSFIKNSKTSLILKLSY